jgi:hypothetical protein
MVPARIGFEFSEGDGMDGRSGWLRRSGALAGGLAATAVLAACGGGSPAASATPGSQAYYQDAVAFAQCMRAHGQPGFPDPQPNGRFLINGPKDHVGGAQMDSANKACQHLLPKPPPLTAAQQRQLTAQALRFVACMRSHGIPDMPDPVVNASGFQISIGGPDGKGPPPGSPILRAAMQACHKLAPGGPL